MDELRAYINALPMADQLIFARRCGTKIGYLRKVLAVHRRESVKPEAKRKLMNISPTIVIAMERESAGAIRCEKILPKTDWRYIRSSNTIFAMREAAQAAKEKKTAKQTSATA